MEALRDVVAHIEDPAHPLTADQLLTQLAWQQWRIRQGDPQPHIPRRKRGRNPAP
jgi:hypothetical protein